MRITRNIFKSPKNIDNIINYLSYHNIIDVIENFPDSEKKYGNYTI